MFREELDQFKSAFSVQEGKEGTTPDIIGVVIYAHDKKLVVVGTNLEGHMQCVRLDAASVDMGNINKTSDRVLDLGSYDDIKVAQVDIGSVFISKTPSIQQDRETVRARISYLDPETGSEEHLTILEEELLKAITREGGGIAVFAGGDEPEENALVIDYQHNGQKHGVMAFFHPVQAIWGFDSVVGVGEFFHLLNEQLLELDSAPFLRSINSAFDQVIQRKLVKISSVRAEVLRSFLIAHARLAMITDEPGHMEILQKYFPGCDTHILRRFFTSITGKGVQIDPSVLGELILRDEGVERESKVEKKVRKFPLKTERMKRLYDRVHDQLGADFGNNDYENRTARVVMQKYFVRITQLDEEVSDQAELEDLLELVEELRGSPWGGSDNTITSNDFPIGGHLRDYYKGEGNWVLSYVIDTIHDHIQVKIGQEMAKKLE
jgi:hypothetical protein